MSFCDTLFDEVEPIWRAQLEHPFVVGIAEGTLEPSTFERWVVQDYQYLQEFARVFAWGAAKAEALEEMQFFAGTLDLTLNTEMELHRDYARRFGIDEEALETAEMWPTTRAYTDFLVRTAADGSMAELLAALLPCAWGYAWLGQQLAETYAPPEDERYADWIATYTDEDFQAAADHLKAMTNRRADRVAEPDRERMIDLFVTSSRYEWKFWEMCWNGETWQP
jgi:thiaminase/transcriptional activator TenA